MGISELSWGTPRFTTLVNNGDPAKRFDIAIMGDGYRAQDQSLFQSDVQAVVNEFRRTEPLRAYFRHLNFHRIDVISPENGTDDIWASPPVIRKTALDTFFSPIADRRLVGPDPWVMTVATMSGAPWDGIIVLVNSRFYGGAVSLLMLVAYVSRSMTMRDGQTADGTFPQVAVHEAGHSMAKLVDEYTELPDIDFPQGWTPPDVLPWVNVSTDGKNPKWKPWVTPGVPLPTPTGTAGDPVGAFEGAFFAPKGLFRPKRDCYMNNHGVPFCEVCAEQWIKVIYEKSKIADSASPSANPFLPSFVTPTQQLRFHVNTVRSGSGIETVWFTKRLEELNWTQRQRTNDYADFTGTFPVNTLGGVSLPTAWQVRCRLRDRSQRIRTPDVSELASQEFNWQVISSAQAVLHGDAVVPHGDANLVPHGDMALIPHGDVSGGVHGDVSLIPHGDVAARLHGDTPVIPHGDVSAGPHGDVSAGPHGDVNVIPHGDVRSILHADIAATHVDVPGIGILHGDARTPHVDTPSAGHIDTPSAAHVDTPAVVHVDVPRVVHVDTPSAGHVDVRAVAHGDTPQTAHIDTPGAVHIDTPEAAHVDTPTTGHIDTPPSHVDVP
ncbi:MAG TPA: M64 family metallopeptidase [Pyrinomonadaceae bacterium]